MARHPIFKGYAPLFVLFFFPNLLSAFTSDKKSFFHRFGLDEVYESPSCTRMDKAFLDYNYDLYISTRAPLGTRECVEERLAAHARVRLMPSRPIKPSVKPASIPLPSKAIAYPNPSRGLINFRVEAGPADIMEVRVLDLSGRTVHQGVLDEKAVFPDGRRIYEHRWETGGHRSGVYVYVISARGGDDGKSWRGKCVLAR
jgi:hypothetical protein